MRPNCDMFAPELVALLDDELPEAEKRAAEQHLAGCSSCTAEVAELARVRDLVSRGLSVRVPTERSGQSPSRFDDLWASIADSETSHAGLGSATTERRLRVVGGAAGNAGRTRRSVLDRGAATPMRGWRWTRFAAAAIAASALVGVVIARRLEVRPLAGGPSASKVARQEPVANGDSLARRASTGSEPTVAAARSARAVAPADVAANSAPGPRDLQVPGELRERLEFFSSYGVVRRLGKLHEFDRLAAPDAQPEVGQTPRGNS